MEEVEAEEEQHQQRQQYRLHPMEACEAYNPQFLTGPTPKQMTFGHSLDGTKWLTAPMTP